MNLESGVGDSVAGLGVTGRAARDRGGAAGGGEPPGGRRLLVAVRLGFLDLALEDEAGLAGAAVVERV